jgi:hypothetical protein
MPDELKTNEEARERFNSVLWDTYGLHRSTISFSASSRYEKTAYIQTFLSKGVMPFLDREVTTEQYIDGKVHITTWKLNELLLLEFVRILFMNAKPLDEAIKVINKIYKEYDPTK